MEGVWGGKEGLVDPPQTPAGRTALRWVEGALEAPWGRTRRRSDLAEVRQGHPPGVGEADFRGWGQGMRKCCVWGEEEGAEGPGAVS